MKKIRNLLFVVCLLISLGVFTSCKKKVETSGTGYGIVHKDYVGVASIKVKDEKVTSLSFEEVYLPENWAQVSDSIDENLYFKATGSHGELTLTKFDLTIMYNINASDICLGGKIFEALFFIKNKTFSLI